MSSNKRFLIGIPLGIGLIVLIGLAAFILTRPQPGRLVLETTEVDFGVVPNDQPYYRTFQVRNEGRGPLEITGISTSCGCTTAAVDTPHLEPGAETALNVTFDPQVHEGATGDFLRKVFLRSNDPNQPEAALTFRVTVVEARPATISP